VGPDESSEPYPSDGFASTLSARRAFAGKAEAAGSVVPPRGTAVRRKHALQHAGSPSLIRQRRAFDGATHGFSNNAGPRRKR